MGDRIQTSGKKIGGHVKLKHVKHACMKQWRTLWLRKIVLLHSVSF